MMKQLPVTPRCEATIHYYAPKTGFWERTTFEVSATGINMGNGDYTAEAKLNKLEITHEVVNLSILNGCFSPL